MQQKDKIILGLVLAILVVGLGSFGVYQNFNKEKEPDVNDNQNNQGNQEENNNPNEEEDDDDSESESKIENPNNISTEVLTEVLDRHRFYNANGKISISDITDEQLTQIAVSRINTYEDSSEMSNCYVSLEDVKKEIPNLFGNVSLKTTVQSFGTDYVGFTLVNGYYKATSGGWSCKIPETYGEIFGANVDKVELSENEEEIYLFDRVLYGTVVEGIYSIYSDMIDSSLQNELEEGQAIESIEKIFQKALKKYPDSAVTYKHTFKKYQGHYYWDHSEIVK